MSKNPVGITDVILRDAHQSLLATRMRLDDMLPMAEKLDRVGFWSVESWGGATFDACIRYLGEDPWERIRKLKSAMPRTPQQMLLRGQNLLGYRHYADDVVDKFVERAAVNGVDVFRVFDALNDVRNMQTAIRAVRANDRHAQGTIAYTVSPVHTIDLWVDLARRIQDLGAQSLCIKDMAGLLRPYVAFDLVSRLKEVLDIPIHMQSHATTGMSTATCLKAIEAGIDNVDTSISSMSLTYGHSPTESLVAILEGTERDTGLDIKQLQEIAGYFRDVRTKYARFEGSLKGIDSRILVSQVPGGMLTNLENQLREQDATARYDEVLAEIPRVRKDLGYIPLVTPTSQIVGTQAVMNVLLGERYKSLAKETSGLLRGEYGATPAPVDPALRERALATGAEITCRPADLIEPELAQITKAFDELAKTHRLQLGRDKVDDVLSYALFPQVALHFLAHRGDASAFEPAPAAPVASTQSAPFDAAADNGAATYRVTVNGKTYDVEVENSGRVAPVAGAADNATATIASTAAGAGTVAARLAGTIFKILVQPGTTVKRGQPVLLLEAMKMETEVVAAQDGLLESLHVREGDAVAVGAPLFTIGR
jgi:oxaloacetate decarboxylase alpha subunit